MGRVGGVSVVLAFSLVVALITAAPAAAKKNSANGEIVAIDGRTITLKVKKDEETFTLTRETEYRRAGEEITAGHLKVGDRVRVKYQAEEAEAKEAEAKDSEPEESEGTEAEAKEPEKVAVVVELWIPPRKLRRGGV